VHALTPAPRFRGRLLPIRFEYIVFNKPFDVLTTFTDSQNRATLADFIRVPHVYAAGRLDRDSEGLLLLTSDGQLAHRLTDPSFKLPKSYLVQVERLPGPEELDRLQNGVVIQGKPTRPAMVEVLEKTPDLWPRSIPIRFRKSVPTTWIRMTIIEGMNRQIRRMTAAVGHPTLRLVRTAIGPIQIGSLGSGEWRRLTRREIRAVRTWPKLLTPVPTEIGKGPF